MCKLKNLGIVLLILSGTGGLHASDQIYRHVDENGNVSFSDRPQQGGERVDLPAVNTTPPPVVVPPPPPMDREESVETTFAYTDVYISQPGNDETVRENAGTLTVSVNTQPPLRSSDTLRLLLNGIASGEQSGGTFQLAEVDRGSHELVAQVLDENGQVLLESAPITVHLMRAAVPRKAPRS